MMGLTPQSNIFGICGLNCLHTACIRHVNSVLAGLSDTDQISILYVRVPEQGKIKKGWVKQLLVISDYKLFLCDDYGHVTEVLDMRDLHFSVSSAKYLDAIHAKKKDIRCILKVTTSSSEHSDPFKSILMLADTEAEKDELVRRLAESNRELKSNNLPETSILVARKLFDDTSTLLMNTTRAVIIDQNRIVLGTEEGMYYIDLDRLEIARIKSERIHQLEYISKEHLLVIVSGEQRQVWLIPIEALDGDGINVTRSQGCSVLAVGPIPGASSTFYLCVCVEEQEKSSMILIYEITSTAETRHNEIQTFCPLENVQSMQLLSDGRLCVISKSCFMIYNIKNPECQPISLLHENSPLYERTVWSLKEALRVVELPTHEYLLVFDTFAVYVDRDGLKSRDREITYLAVSTHIAYRNGHLVVYSDTYIDIFDCATGELVQTEKFKIAKPLNDAGTLTICTLDDLNNLLYSSKIHQSISIKIIRCILGQTSPQLNTIKLLNQYSQM